MLENIILCNFSAAPTVTLKNKNARSRHRINTPHVSPLYSTKFHSVPADIGFIDVSSLPLWILSIFSSFSVALNFL